ncbi:MAG: di-heme enzyme [Deltaproteobacteria bacterium]|nr:di-heme enzyme [Deltaproteobacteria bacterium]
MLLLWGAAGFLAHGCVPAAGTAWEWDLPSYLEPPPIPEGESVTEEKVALGRRLFYDVRLSGNETQSCATCHEQARGFADGEATPEGSTGVVLDRNSMSLANLGWFTSYTWPNALMDTLERQALVPLVGDTPPELHAGSDLERVLSDMESDPWLGDAFVAAFPELDEPVGIDPIVRALAAFERTMVSLDSPYDRYLQGDDGALSPEAQRGLELFEGDILGCADCHAGPLQTTATQSNDRAETFVNTGLYEQYPPFALGLLEITGEASDMGRFRVPSLRNVAVSAPYFHDGSGPDLDAVLDHYAAGGRTLEQGPWAGDGSNNPNKDPRISGFELGDEDRSALLAFLDALTDPSYLSAPELSDPYGD